MKHVGGNVLFFRPNSLASWCIRLGLPNFGQKKYGPSAMIMIFQQLNLNILYIFCIYFWELLATVLGILGAKFSHISSCWNCAASDARNFVPQGRCETASSAVCGSGVSWVRVFFLVVCKNLAQNDDFSAGQNSGYWAWWSMDVFVSLPQWKRIQRWFYDRQKSFCFHFGAGGGRAEQKIHGTKWTDKCVFSFHHKMK